MGQSSAGTWGHGFAWKIVNEGKLHGRLRGYGALNQARIALENRYQFGPTQNVTDVETFPAPKRSAFIRRQFYCALQSVLLEHVIE